MLIKFVEWAMVCSRVAIFVHGGRTSGQKSALYLFVASTAFPPSLSTSSQCHDEMADPYPCEILRRCLVFQISPDLRVDHYAYCYPSISSSASNWRPPSSGRLKAFKCRIEIYWSLRRCYNSCMYTWEMLIYDSWWVMAWAMKLLNLDFVLETFVAIKRITSSNLLTFLPYTTVPSTTTKSTPSLRILWLEIHASKLRIPEQVLSHRLLWSIRLGLCMPPISVIEKLCT